MKTYDELLAERDGLKYHLARVLDAYGGNSGFEPSLSVFLRAIDEAKKALNESPQQCLAEIRAEAGRAGYLACAREYGTARLNGSEQSIKRHAELYSLAVKYSVSEAMLGVAVTWLLDNRSKKPQFSVACGLVFNDNEDAEEFDSHMSEVAFDYGIHLSPTSVVELFSIADQYAAKLRQGEVRR